MALNYKKQKNLVRSPDEYTRYYGNFRGVDFSSDHTEVHEQRFAYAINMYKDYRTGEGNAIETIPGFRRRFEAPITEDDQHVITKYQINGIHEFQYVKTDGTRDKDILIHAGNYIYRWDNYPYSVNVLQQYYVQLKRDETDIDEITHKGKLKVEIDFPCEQVKQVQVDVNSILTSEFKMKTEGDKKYVEFNEKAFGKYVNKFISVDYYEKTMEATDAIYAAANDAESKSFAFNNRLYILDGTQLLVYYKSSETSDTFTIESVFADTYTSEAAYLPTVYRNIGVGDNAPEEISKYEYEQKNLLNPYFKHTYIPGDDETTYPLYDDGTVIAVKVNDTTYTEGGTDDYGYTISNNSIVFNKAPTQAAGKPKACVEVIFQKAKDVVQSDKDKIFNCTVVATFDKRVFLTGNPSYPNHIWYCGYNNTVGYEDARYFGELDYVIDGVENAPITGMIPVADTLAVLKNYTKQDASVYFHTRLETNSSVVPVTYPAEPGLSGIGCLGACVNFLDDPIFISRLGVEGIGQLSVRLERAIEHRSSLVDAKLVNLDLKDAKLTEWDGYLVVLTPDGKMFLADSRQKYTHDTGVPQYEWYYLEGIGVYEDDHDQYYYASEKYSWITDEKVNVKRYNENNIETNEEYEIDVAKHIYNSTYTRSENLTNSPVELDSLEIANKRNEPDITTKTYTYTVKIGETEETITETAYFVVRDTWDGETYVNGLPYIVPKAIVCDYWGSKTGGTFKPAKKVVTIEENIEAVSTESMVESMDTNADINANTAANIFFGTENGVVCSFNFDMKNADGTISPKHYSFDSHAIYCGIATKMDNCGIPHLTKSTIKKSTVIKTKSMVASTAKVRVRTNNKGYASVARVNSRIFSFDTIDFSDFSFVADEQTIFAIKEKEKHWVEKQHWIYSDEYQRPFSVHYLAFRYKVSGRIKG